MEKKDLIISERRSVIVAADVNNVASLIDVVEATIDVPGISAYKIGASLVKHLDNVVSNIRKIGARKEKNPSIIYDHQKAGNDIPDIGTGFAKMLAESGVDVAILFPFAGPATQEKWTMSCFEAGLKVITGGIMTHPKFLVSEGGYIADDAPERIIRLAVELEVRHFVVPGTKLNWVQKIKELLDSLLGSGNYVLYAPGFVDQGGIITECGKFAGDNWHAIVGSAIYKKKTPAEMREAAILATSQINNDEAVIGLA